MFEKLSINRKEKNKYSISFEVEKSTLDVFFNGIKELKRKENKIKLTKREYEVINILLQGKTNSEIAKELNVSTHTIKAHLAKIFEKLEVHDRVEVAVKVLQENLI